MNRRSMIMNAALGTAATLLDSGEVTAQSRGGKASVTNIGKQAWKYKFRPANQEAVDRAGREMWEAVCLIENNIILFKHPA